MKNKTIKFLIDSGMILLWVLFNFIAWKWVIPALIAHGSSLGLELGIALAIITIIASGYVLLIVFNKWK